MLQMPGFLSELNKRNVFRVAIAYLVMAWVIAQVAGLAAESFEAPGWVMRMIITVLTVGFLPALFFAWAFELTPEGIKRERDVDRDTPAPTHTARKLDIVVIVLLVAAIGLFLGHRYLPGTSPAPPPATVEAEGLHSIAVLPFDDFSPNRDQGFLAEGIAETLLHALAQVDGLKVSARTSSFAFRGRDADVGTIGRELGVATVLEGSVQRVGDRLRVVAQLVRTGDQSHIWSLTFDQDADDIFSIQDEIAGQVVQALLGNGAGDQVESARTEVSVYDLYLEGRQLWQRRDGESVDRAVELLEEAVRIDPVYAPARAELALALMFQVLYGDTELEQSRARIEEEIRRALSLDASASQAYAARGLLLDELGLHRESLSALLIAESISPNDANIQAWLGNRYQALVNFDKAVEHFARAFELDPLNPFVRGRYITNLAMMQPDSARLEEIARESIRLFPDRRQSWTSLVNVRIIQGRDADAALALLGTMRQFPDQVSPIAWMAIIFDGLGDFETADRWYEYAQARGADAGNESWRYFPRGDGERMLELARQEFERSGDMTLLLPALRILGEFEEVEVLVASAIERLAADPEHAAISEREFEPLLTGVWLARRGGNDDVFQQRRELMEFFWRRVRDTGFPEDNVMPALGIAAAIGDRAAVIKLAPEVRPQNRKWLEWGLRHDPFYEEYTDAPEMRAFLRDSEMKRQEELEAMRAAGEPALFDPALLES